MVKEISARDLEEACRKCVRTEVSDVKSLAVVLDRMKIGYNILSESQADIFARVNVSELAMELAKVNCQIISMEERDESLESYFVSLVGGASHE